MSYPPTAKWPSGALRVAFIAGPLAALMALPAGAQASAQAHPQPRTSPALRQIHCKFGSFLAPIGCEPYPFHGAPRCKRVC